MRFWQVLVASALILSAGLGLLIMSGGARGLLAPSLQADLAVQDFPLPPDMGVDPTRVAAFMAGELQQRLEGDVAIRLTLTGEAAQKVRDIVLPRLMNVVAVQAMMSDIPELSALLDLGSFRRTVSGEVSQPGPGRRRRPDGPRRASGHGRRGRGGHRHHLDRPDGARARRDGGRPEPPGRRCGWTTAPPASTSAGRSGSAPPMASGAGSC